MQTASNVPNCIRTTPLPNLKPHYDTILDAMLPAAKSLGGVSLSDRIAAKGYRERENRRRVRCIETSPYPVRLV